MWKNIWESIKADFAKNKVASVIYLIILIVVYIVLFSFMPEPELPEEVTYMDFLNDLHAGKIDTV